MLSSEIEQMEQSIESMSDAELTSKLIDLNKKLIDLLRNQEKEETKQKLIDLIEDIREERYMRVRRNVKNTVRSIRNEIIASKKVQEEFLASIKKSLEEKKIEQAVPPHETERAKA